MRNGKSGGIKIVYESEKKKAESQEAVGWRVCSIKGL